MKIGRFYIICLIAVFVLALTGCSKVETDYSQNPTSSEQTEGINLPDEQFNSSDDKNESKDSVTSEKDESDNPSSEESSSSDPLKEDDQTSSDSGDNTSSDVASSKPDDGNVELPFDKW